MGSMTVCLCVLMCVVAVSGVPVPAVEFEASTEGSPAGLQRVFVVKRSAQYHTGRGFPCSFSAYRCPYPDIPALCRVDNPFPCDTDFVTTNL